MNIGLGPLVTGESTEHIVLSIARNANAEPLSFASKIGGFFLGNYGWFFPILFFILIGFSGTLIVLGIRDKSLRRSKQNSDTKPKPAPPRRGYERFDSGEDEYSRLLALFELDDTATNADIKNAYRKMARDLHPDSARTESPEEASERMQRFSELQEVYDRIIEIRSLGFGKRR